MVQKTSRGTGIFAAALLFGAVLANATIVYVGDASSNAVYYFNSTNGAYLNISVSTNGTPGQMATLGNLYVADSIGSLGSTVDVFNANTGGASIMQIGGGYLVAPVGLAFSPAGNLYVADAGVGGVTTTVDEFTSGGTYLGQVPTASAGLGAPDALAFGPNGNLFIADSSGRIYQYDGTTVSLFATVNSVPGGAPAVNLTFGPNGNLYVTDGNYVYEFDGTTGSQIGTTFATPSGSSVLGLAFGPDGSLYIADSLGVEVADAATGVVSGTPFITANVGSPLTDPQFLTFQTPEPSAALLAALGLITLISLRLRRRSA